MGIVFGLRDFVAHSGVSGVIWSDNGTNVIATEEELLNNVLNWNQQTLTDSLVKKGIKLKFNPPSAPHPGGVWDQLLCNFKHTFYFYAILGNQRLTDEFFSTTFCIVELSLNARPLVAASAFNPNHFLLGIAGSSLPSLVNCDFDNLKRYTRAHAYSDAIWSRWLKKCVPSLNTRTKWPSPSNRNLQTGDLVWIVEPTNLRGYYPLDRLEELNFGSDAVSRSAEFRTASGNVIRPVVELAPALLVSDADRKIVFDNVNLFSLLA